MSCASRGTRSVQLDIETVGRFGALLAQRIGLALGDDKLDTLRTVLTQRCRSTSLEPEVYLARLARLDPASSELPELAKLLTVGETYFFRSPGQLNACMEVAVPAFRSAGDGIRILSAACASGEEPYSLAILLRERHAGVAASILGVDLNPVALERARSAHYSSWALRETSDVFKRRYFRAQNRGFQLDPTIRSAVRFESVNLAEANPVLLPNAGYEIIFCRNALMYFTAEKCLATIARLSQALVPGGYLFLGHVETLRGVTHDFELCHSHDSFYYRKSDARRAAVPSARVDHSPLVEGSAAPIPLESDWFDTIQRASARVHDLSNDLAPPPPHERDADPAKPAELFDLLQREMFTQALVVMRSTDELHSADGDALLLRAIVSAHAGQFEAARALCDRLLQSDELNAAAQYVLALCQEGSGDSASAIHHDRLSAYLDPTFAMPRVHLGLLLQRHGRLAEARHELHEARSLLEREDPLRLLLFGGGFGRSALLALCNTDVPASLGAAR
jgi:chemotaxis protein methyltransferase CheR